MKRTSGLILLLILAGCTSSGNAPAATPADDAVVIPPVSFVAAQGQPVLVSPAGHRIAEFMVARNPLDPDHLLIAAHDYDSGTGTLACVVYVSRDGGLSWSSAQKVPGLDRSHLQFDGWISFDLEGTAHYICLDTAGPNGQTWPYYSHSTDGGMAWSEAVLIPTATDGQSIDKSALHAARDGTVYAAFSGQVARTRDAGATWDRGAATEAGSNPNGFAEDRNGTVYLWVRGGGMGRVAYTHDGGTTWNRTDVGPFAIPPGYNDQNRWVDQRPWTTLPSIAISNRTDHLLVAQQSWDTGTSLYVTTVYRSTDSGTSFHAQSSPEFASPTCSPCHVTKPSIAIDDAGRLGLLVQLVDDGGHTKEVWFTVSSDEGATWTPPVALSKTSMPDGWLNANAFTPAPEGLTGWAQNLAAQPTDAVPTVLGLALTTAVQELQMRWNGEYWGLGVSSHGFVATWIDHSADGVPQLFAQVVTPE